VCGIKFITARLLFFNYLKKKKVRLFTTQRQNFLTRKRELLLFFKKEGLTKMASGGILTTVGPSLIVWKVGPLLLNQINTLCTHTHTQTIYTDSTLRLQQQQPCVKDISF
jgi:hypothetical protein